MEFDTKGKGICGGWTDAPYASTTEVYPDSLKEGVNGD